MIYKWPNIFADPILFKLPGLILFEKFEETIIYFSAKIINYPSNSIEEHTISK
jgi:hypothetical protein